MPIRFVVEFLATDFWLEAAAPGWEAPSGEELEILGLGNGTLGIKPVAPARGLPVKHSAEVEHVFGTGNVDRSHLLLKEFLDYDWSQVAGAGRASDLPLRKYVDALLAWAGIKGLMPHQVRVVFGVTTS